MGVIERVRRVVDPIVETLNRIRARMEHCGVVLNGRALSNGSLIRLLAATRNVYERGPHASIVRRLR